MAPAEKRRKTSRHVQYLYQISNFWGGGRGGGELFASAKPIPLKACKF